MRWIFGMWKYIWNTGNHWSGTVSLCTHTQALWMLLRLFKIHVVIRCAMDKVHTMLYLFDCWHPMQKEFPPTFDRQNMIWERWAHDIWVFPKNIAQSNHTFHYFGSLRGFLSNKKNIQSKPLLHLKLKVKFKIHLQTFLTFTMRTNAEQCFHYTTKS